MTAYQLFYALWPDDEVREELADAARWLPKPGSRAYRVRPDRYHVTLLYLGESGEPELQAALAAGNQVRAPAFWLHLDRMGAFPRARVWWAGTEAKPPELQDLSQQLRSAAASAGLQFDAEPLKPHVSLIREARGSPALKGLAPIHWPVRDFALINSVLSPKTAHYEVLKRWPLDSAGPLQEMTGDEEAADETVGK